MGECMSLWQLVHVSVCHCRSAITTSSTAPSAGSTGSWAVAAMVGRWPRSSCRSTARVAAKTAPSWCERARPLSETTRYRSGQSLLENTKQHTFVFLFCLQDFERKQ